MTKIPTPKSGNSEKNSRDASRSHRNGSSISAHYPSHTEREEFIPCDHFVQFYENDAFLIESLVSFISAGFGADESAIVIATEEHRCALSQQLLKQGIDLSVLQVRGQYLALDAAET